MALISTKEFSKIIEKALDDGRITNEEYDDYVYQCAYNQAYNPNQLYEVMSYIVSQIPSELPESTDATEDK